VLAGEPSTGLAVLDNQDLFRTVLRELGRDPLPAEQALWELIRLRCSDIVDGSVSPYDGALRIERLMYVDPSLPDAFWSITGWFSGLSDEWGGGSGAPQPEVEREIVRAARLVLAADSPGEADRRPGLV
jgi:hypothetical protein